LCCLAKVKRHGVILLVELAMVQPCLIDVTYEALPFLSYRLILTWGTPWISCAGLLRSSIQTHFIIIIGASAISRTAHCRDICRILCHPGCRNIYMKYGIWVFWARVDFVNKTLGTSNSSAVRWFIFVLRCHWGDELQSTHLSPAGQKRVLYILNKIRRKLFRVQTVSDSSIIFFKRRWWRAIYNFSTSSASLNGKFQNSSHLCLPMGQLCWKCYYSLRHLLAVLK